MKPYRLSLEARALIKLINYSFVIAYPAQFLSRKSKAKLLAKVILYFSELFLINPKLVKKVPLGWPMHTGILPVSMARFIEQH